MSVKIIKETRTKVYIDWILYLFEKRIAEYYFFNAIVWNYNELIDKIIKI